MSYDQMAASLAPSLKIWQQQIKCTTASIDKVFKTERMWSPALSALIACFAEEYVLVHVPWITRRGLDVLFRSKGVSYEGVDKRWTIWSGWEILSVALSLGYCQMSCLDHSTPQTL
jgi:hypothetical protein